MQLFRGNWWIRVKNQWIGYYPASLFATSGLRNKGSKIAWYGEITDADDDVKTYTDMGSGRFASQGWRKAAYMRNILYYNNDTGYSYHYNPLSRDIDETAGCYTIDDHFRSGSGWGSYMYFGGPGNNTNCR